MQRSLFHFPFLRERVFRVLRLQRRFHFTDRVSNNDPYWSLITSCDMPAIALRLAPLLPRPDGLLFQVKDIQLAYEGLVALNSVLRTFPSQPFSCAERHEWAEAAERLKPQITSCRALVLEAVHRAHDEKRSTNSDWTVQEEAAVKEIVETCKETQLLLDTIN